MKDELCRFQIMPAAVALQIALTIHVFVMPGLLAAGEPRYETTVLTDSKETKAAKSLFTPATPNIYVVFTLADVPSGTPIRALWIAEKTDVAPENYKIDEATLGAGGLTKSGNFSMSRPNNGWPVGQYRVELFMSGKLAKTIRFSRWPHKVKDVPSVSSHPHPSQRRAVEEPVPPEGLSGTATRPLLRILGRPGPIEP